MKRFSAQTLLPTLLLTAALSEAAPVVNPASVTVGKAWQVQFNVAGLGADVQPYFRPGGPYLQKTLPLQGARTLAVNDSLAVVTKEAGGIDIIGLNDSGPTGVVGHFKGHGHYEHAQVQGIHAYLTRGMRLDIVDLKNPARPRAAGSYHAHAPIKALAVNKTLAALLSNEELLLVDVSRPRQSHTLARLALSFSATALALQDNRLYLATAERGLLSIDLSDLRRPRTSGQYQTSGPVLDLDVRDGLALLANGENGITLLDVAKPDRLLWLGSHQQLGDVRRVHTLPNGQALVINSHNDLLLLDIGSPDMPSLISTLPLHRPLTDFATDGTQTVALLADGIATLDTSALPPQIGNEGLDFGQGVNYGGQRRLVVRDNIAYVADWFSGIHLYNLGNPLRPRLLASLHTPGSPKGIVVRDDIAYVADDDHGLQVVNIADPLRPRLIANLATPGLAYTPVLDGDRLYLASHRGGFQIIDVSDPAAPQLLASQSTPGKAWSIQVQKDLAYVADDESGLLIYDVFNPKAPQLVGRFNPGTAAEDVLIDGNIAYVAFFDDGLYVLDISDPDKPRSVVHLPTPGNARGLERQGDYLYIADWLAGVQVVDISNPFHAHFVGSYDTEGAAWGLRVAGHYAFVADWWGGLFVLDVNQPTQPQLVGSYLHHDPVTQIASRGQYAYVAKGRDGLQIFDINNPLNPTWVTGVDLTEARGLVLRHGRAYVALPRGIAVVDIRNPFQARRIDTLSLAHPVEKLRRGGNLLYAAAGEDLSIIDSTSLEVSQHTVPGGMMDLWADDNTLFILGRDGTIHSYPGADFRHPGPDRRLPAGGNAGLLRTAGKQLYVYRENSGIHILRRDPEKTVTTGHIPLDIPLRDLQAGAGRLYAVTDDNRILVYTIDDAGNGHILNEYRTLNPIASLHLKNNVLYGSGGRHIVAIQDLPAIDIAGNRAKLPPTLPTGTYDLVLRDADGTLLRRFPNALSVVPPRFKQPAFTMEDLQKALKQRHTAQSTTPDDNSQCGQAMC